MKAQIITFFEELLLFVDMIDFEQEMQMSGRLPTIEEYQQRRTGSSAVGMCLAITE